MFTSRDVRPPGPRNVPAERPAPPASSRSARFIKKRWWIVVVVLVLAAGVFLLAYGYITTRNQLTQLSHGANSKGKSEVEQLTQQKGAYLQLPNETPTLATVSDASRLKGQEFFKNAQNNDKVLIFPTSGRALLYRPSTHKVIEYAKVNLGTNGTP